jgi:hypothetical protein
MEGEGLDPPPLLQTEGGGPTPPPMLFRASQPALPLPLVQRPQKIASDQGGSLKRPKIASPTGGPVVWTSPNFRGKCTRTNNPKYAPTHFQFPFYPIFHTSPNPFHPFSSIFTHFHPSFLQIFFKIFLIHFPLESPFTSQKMASERGGGLLTRPVVGQGGGITDDFIALIEQY